MLDAWFAEGNTTATAAFVDRSLAALVQAYGPELAAPRLALFRALFFQDEAIVGDLKAELHRRFHISSLSSMRGTLEDPEVAPWYASSELTTVFMVAPQHVAGLVAAHVLSEVEAKALSTVKGPTLFGKPRSAHEWVTVIVASDLAAAASGLDVLALAKAPISGRVDAPPSK